MGLPVPNLDDKTFDELVKDARSLISRYAPDWTDHNVHDPGITFLELFAWLAETQIYQLNRVTDLHYLRFLKLLGLHPHPVQPARVGVTFEDVTDIIRLKKGAQLITELNREEMVFETEEEFTLVPLINAVRLNTIPVVQVKTIKDENIGKGYGIPELTVELRRTPVIKGSQTIQVQGKDGEWEEWLEVEGFESSDPDDRHYTFDPDKGLIRFGNGLNGRVPEESQEIRASYKTTLGEKGNIPSGCKFLINKDGLEGIKGTNHDEGTGGKAAESIEDAKDRAGKEFRSIYRAVTSGDLERLAIATPGLRVKRAKAIPGYHPGYPCISVPDAVTVVVVPFAREGTYCPVPGGGFLQTVSRHLDALRLVTTDLHVVGPLYVKVSVACKVRVTRKASPEEVKKVVLQRLAQFLDPFVGGPDGKGWPFGRPVYPSEIYQILDKTEGVDYATGAIITEGSHSSSEIIKISPIALVVSGEHQVEII